MIDAHIHIDFYDKPIEIIKQIWQREISSIFVTHLPELYFKHKEMLKDNPLIFLAVGFHPMLVNQYDFDEQMFIKALESTRFVGEVGLDFTVARSESSKTRQINIFEKICKHSFNHILSIHSRNAENEVYNILQKYSIENAIFHWYTGTIDLIPQIIEAGYFFSINPTMLRSHKGRNILSKIPLNRILIESDGPFTKYKGKLIEPILMKDIYMDFQKFYNVSNLQEIVLENIISLVN